MNDSEYVATIGLEIHSELATNSKMFCSCKNDPDEENPNVNICPICLGHPGTLPVLNKEAINRVLKIGVALNGTLADFTEWDRKNYFYPDIPKGYQISQYKYPLVSGGSLAGIELERIHLEEDTAQSTHDTHDKSLINFNRAGVPLMELVTKPVIHDAATAVRFAKELQLLLRYLDVGEANMEKGEMRIEANISVAPTQGLALTATGDSRLNLESVPLGTKTEVKNLNSFRSVEKAIEYEIGRQSELLRDGGKVVQETRGWRPVDRAGGGHEQQGETYSMRKKESSHDYRYFPDPDIPKLKLSEISEFSLENLKKELPELPWIKRNRFKKDFGMTDKEIAVFVESPEIADYYEEVVSYFPASDAKLIKLATNYILTDYLKLVRNTGAVTDLLWNLSPSVFAELIAMINAGELSSRGAKDLLKILFIEKSVSAKKVAEAEGLIQKNDPSTLIPAIEQVLTDNPKAIAEYKTGKLASLQFLVGMAMKTTKGAGNPEMIKKLLLERLE